jgi:hypothetical protein
VAERKARQLTLDVADDQPVFDQIEYVEYLIQLRPGSSFGPSRTTFPYRPSSRPAGNTVYGKHRKRRPEIRERRHCNWRTITSFFCQQKVQKRLAADYPAERLEASLVEQMKQIRREQPEWFARVPDATRREVALGRLKSRVRQSLDLPTREAWSRQNPQQRLY